MKTLYDLHPGLVKEMQKPSKIGSDASVLARAYITYQDTVLSNLDLINAGDSKKYNQLLKPLNDAFIKEWGQDAYDYVQLALVEGKGYHPILKGQIAGGRAINQSGYWEILEDMSLTPQQRSDAQIKMREDNPLLDAWLYTLEYSNTIQTEQAA